MTENKKTLVGYKVLVTAGPTWVPLDKVRVITSIFSGSTGLSIAAAFASAGAETTLLLGPGFAQATAEQKEAMDIQRFRFFREFAEKLESTLDENRFDIIIHSAAVADYEPADFRDEKIPSGYDELQITLKPTRKLIKMIREKAPDAFLVQFKLETGKTSEELISAAWQALADSGGDIVVANLLEDITETTHRAYIINPARKVSIVESKAQLSAQLVSITATALKCDK
jgi:phosphopantothenoylcysteine synthetase/decarboxylase